MRINIIGIFSSDSEYLVVSLIMQEDVYKLGKKNIYYARTYRRVQLNPAGSMVAACLLIIPVILCMITHLDDITLRMSEFGVRTLSRVIQPEYIDIAGTTYSVIDNISYIVLPTKAPTLFLCCINLAVCIVIMIFMRLLRRTGRPLAIFMMFSLFIHIVSCIYFILAKEYFPYTVGMYSELYVKQQIGIWLIFIVLAGLLVTFMGRRRYLYRLITFAAIMSYSVVFGTIRYVIYLYILYRFSTLYMALLFFVVGPMYDFAYLVAIYAMYVNRNIKDYAYGRNRGVWKWS